MITTQKAAVMLNMSTRRVRKLCEEGRVVGAKKIGDRWILPESPVVLAIKQASSRAGE